ncbi:pentapeptide repeat-containing protein [Paenibacillus agricola]|uniref:Pentapeptide repeat-containing protein n=1 Tax=Paenibacillus agricola TaxID=2716264 RepID=A0ABX0JJL9_9BACL|nr:pentapeptide repeat-containing protein [Paenibacillus agricola]NHN34719.1 pentapeptide repeat-containing protein [Paenibacillus agricola]
MSIDGAQWGGAHFQYIGYGNQSQPDVEHNKESVRFSNCNFQNGLITGCNLSNANLENCDISGLVINGINIENLIKQYQPIEQK